MAELVMGLDIGTTSIKVALVQLSDGQTVQSRSRDTGAQVQQFEIEDPELACCTNEQEAHKILNALHVLVSGLPKDALIRVRRVAVCGQMHGVLLWKHGAGWTRTAHGRYEAAQCSRLITWQDGRCSSEFLKELPTPQSHLRLCTGYGCASLFWLKKHKPEQIKEYDRAGTVQDMVVAMLCGLEKPKMSVQNAASWGYMDTAKAEWNTAILSEAGFPVELLPDILQSGDIAGQFPDAWCGIPKGTEVVVALGDLQCSVRAVETNPGEAVLNLSTSAQLAFVLPATDNGSPPIDRLPPEVSSSVELFPYFDRNEYLAVAAALTGGNAMAAFVKLLQQWSHELGLGIPQADIWNKLGLLGEQAQDTDLCISPCVFGERHDPDRRGSVSNVTAFNLGLGQVYRSLCQGVVANIAAMFPASALAEVGVQGIVGGGSALLRNKILQECLTRCYQPLTIRYVDGAEAAVGAAKIASKTFQN